MTKHAVDRGAGSRPPRFPHGRRGTDDGGRRDRSSRSRTASIVSIRVMSVMSVMSATSAAGRFVRRILPPLNADPLDPRGDDSPDILDYQGHGEVSLGWRGSRREYSSTIHGNPSTGKGGGRVAVSFPVFGRFRAIVSYFNGYGDSLIDHDHFQQRLGAGLLLSNLF